MAEKLTPRVDVVPEVSLLDELEIDVPEIARLSRFPLVEAAGLSGLERKVLQHCVREGLLEADRFGRVSLRDIRAAQTAIALAPERGGLQRLARSLQRLRKYLPGTARPLEQVDLVRDFDRRLIAVLADGLVRDDGQRLFGFMAGPEPDSAVSIYDAYDDPRSIALRAVALEEDGRLLDAAEAYERALAREPSADLCFNQGNVLRELGHIDAAHRSYSLACDLEPAHADARFNRGNIELDRGSFELALGDFRAVLATHPYFADAHYNAAISCEHLGDLAGMRHHYEAYIRLDHDSVWADHAFEKIAAVAPSSSRVALGRSHGDNSSEAS